MARCARRLCRRWRPTLLIERCALGLSADNVWFCSPDCLAAETADRLRASVFPAAPSAFAVPPLRLGVLLVHQGAITTKNLTAALTLQRASGRRLGDELVHLGFCTAQQVLKGLAAQAGVSYLGTVHPGRVRVASCGLSADEVRALGLVPVGGAASSRLLMVACTAPVPRAALAALGRLTGWNPEPYLVTDADFTLLMDAYGVAAPLPGPERRFVKVRDVDDAARRIAAAVTDEHSISMTEAHCAPFTWVRVAGARAVNTLLVPHEQEVICQAATTLH